MAISPMKKMYLVSHASIKEEVVEALRKTGRVHIVDINAQLPPSQEEKKRAPEKDLAALEEQYSQTEYIIGFFDRFFPKPSLLHRLLHPKLLITEKEEKEITEALDLQALSERCQGLERELVESEREEEKKSLLRDSLLPWIPLKAPLEAITDTQTTSLCLGHTEAKALEPLLTAMKEKGLPIHFHEVQTWEKRVYFLLICLHGDTASLHALIKEHHGQMLSFGGIWGTPEERIKGIEEELKDLEDRKKAVEREAFSLAQRERSKVLILHDYLWELLEKGRIEKCLYGTEHTFLLKGWLRAWDEGMLINQLKNYSHALQMSFEEPDEKDEVPIILENPRIFAPFEFITNMYSSPLQGEYDPTPLFAPFFIFFFGFCLTDAGYGLVLFLLSMVALMALPLEGIPLSLLKVLLLGGLSTIVLGALTGGWFGISADHLPEVLKKLIIIDPLKEPMKVLNICFIIGIVQVFFGMAIKAAGNIKAGKWLDALMDQGLWIFFLTCMAILGLDFTFSMADMTINPSLVSFARKSFWLPLILLALTQGRSHKSWLLKLPAGLFEVYGASTYFGHVLSYTRLLALALTTSYMAMTVNIVAGMVSSSFSFLGIFLAIPILLVGHSFAITINTLGAFVHSMRLQYLEFFSKFFQGGGRPFVPFQPVRRYTQLMT